MEILRNMNLNIEQNNYSSNIIFKCIVFYICISSFTKINGNLIESSTNAAEYDHEKISVRDNNKEKGFLVGVETKIWELKITNLNGKNVATTERTNLMMDAYNFLSGRQEDLDPEQVTTTKQQPTELPSLTEIKNTHFQILSKGVPEAVHPEIVIFLDDSFCKKFEGSEAEMIAYITTFMSAVEKYFRHLLNKPQILLNIGAIVLLKLGEQNLLDKKSFLLDLGKYTNTFCQKMGCNTDIDIVIVGDERLKFEGYSQPCSACVKASNTIIKDVVTVNIFDDAMFSGISDLVHALSRLFCSPVALLQDVEGSSGNTVKDLCSDYTKSYQNDLDNWVRSSCDKQTLYAFLSSAEAECLRNDPSTERKDKKLPSILPGKYMSLNKQCKKMGFAKSSAINETVCENILCGNNEGITLKNDKRTPALEGSPCGLSRYCIQGKCEPPSNASNLNEDYEWCFKLIFWIIMKIFLINYQIYF